MMNLKKKLAAGFAVGLAVVVAAVIPQVLPSKAVVAAHESQGRINGDIGFVEVSAAHYVSADNPKGWGYPHFSAIERDGWTTPELLKYAKLQRSQGKKILALWEPSCQTPGLGECMAWASPADIKECWTDQMRLTWPRFVAELRAGGMEPMWYVGCAGKHASTIVEDLAFIRSMGVWIVGLDAFSWMVHEDPAGAEAVITALRADPRTKDLTLVTEGWLPVELEGARRAFFLRHLVQMDLARGGDGKAAIDDPNWARMKGIEMDRRIVVGCRGVVVMQGANWKPGDLESNYAQAEALGLSVCDWRERPKP